MGEENNEENQNIEFLNVTGRGRLHSWVGVGNNNPSEVPTSDNPIEIPTNGKKSISENVNKKRPRIKTHAKSMIQVRRNYATRTEPEPENEVTEVIEDIEATEEEERSPKSKKKKRENKGEKHNLRPEDVEVDKWTIEAYLSYTCLESSADDKNIKEIIKCMEIEEIYLKKYQKTKKNIVDYLTSFSQEDKEQILSGAIEFINDEGLPANFMTQKSESQIINLIVALRNMMPNWCTGCKDWYSVKRGDKPKLRCMLCNVGRHECDKNNESHIGDGIVWICPECIDINISEGFFEKAKAQSKEMIVNRDNKRKKDEIKVAAEIHREEVTVGKLNSEMRAKLNAKRNNKPKRDEEQGKKEVVIVVEEGIPIEETTEAPSNEASREKDIMDVRTTNMKSQKTCIYWLKGRCKFEAKCWYQHPKRCENQHKFGECFNDECKELHLTMCRDMYERGICEKGRYCNYAHQLYVKTKIHDNQKKEQQIKYNERLDNGSRNNPRVDYRGGRNNSRMDHNNRVRKHSNYQRHENFKREDCEDFMRTERMNLENNFPRHDNARSQTNRDFLRSERMKWEDMRTPMFRYAAEILAEKMMHM